MEVEKATVNSTSNIFGVLSQLSSYEAFQALMDRLDLPQLVAQDIYTKLVSISECSPQCISGQDEEAPQDNEYLSMLTADYVRRRLSDRLYHTIQALTMEALHFATGEPMSVSELRALYDGMVTPTATERRDDLPIKRRGGDRRTQYEWSDERYIAYSRIVDDLRLLWNSIVAYYDDNDYRLECVITVKQTDFYKRFSKKYKKVPEILLQKVLRRKHQKGRNYWPFTFALEHARREMGIEYPYSIDSLNKFYKEGIKLRGPVL